MSGERVLPAQLQVQFPRRVWGSEKRGERKREPAGQNRSLKTISYHREPVTVPDNPALPRISYRLQSNIWRIISRAAIDKTIRRDFDTTFIRFWNYDCYRVKSINIDIICNFYYIIYKNDWLLLQYSIL